MYCPLIMALVLSILYAEQISNGGKIGIVNVELAIWEMKGDFESD